MNRMMLCGAMLTATISLTGCMKDGKDGVDGDMGPVGDTGPAGADAPIPSLDLTILHLNDTHSHVEPHSFDYDVSGLTLQTTDSNGDRIDEVGVSYGGYPAITSVIKTIEQQQEHVIKLNAGDAITGTTMYTFFGGRVAAELMNNVCFDAYALGNHDFDNGDLGLANFIDMLNSTACNTPILAANVTPADTSALANGYIQPYTLIERGGQQIGIIGIDIAQKTLVSSSPDAGTTFADEVVTAQAQIDVLSAQGVENIILLTHYGYDNEVALAQAVTGVDVVVGGDSHSLLGDETLTDLGFNVSGEYPTVTTNADGETVCIVQAWEYGRVLGRLDVTFDDGVVTNCQGSPILPLTGNFTFMQPDAEWWHDPVALDYPDTDTIALTLTPEDELLVANGDGEAQRIIDEYNALSAEARNTVVGEATEDLCFERYPGQGRSSICDVQNTYLHGSDITAVISKAFLKMTPTADLAIQNAGGVRDDLPQGPITFDTVLTLLPFANTIVEGSMTGQQIVDVLEEALANTLDDGGSTGSYPYAAGLQFDVDASASAGNRISNVLVNPQLEGEWSALDLTASYRVVTNSFVAGGRDGYVTFGDITWDDTFREYSQALVDYLDQFGGTISKLPYSEYSTQSYTDESGCLHTNDFSCLAE